MFKTYAAARYNSLTEFIVEAMREKMAQDLKKQPNDETLKAFKESESGEGLFKSESLEELFKELDI